MGEENYTGGASASSKQKWGRVLICGGTDWPALGKKDRQGKSLTSEDHPDLPEPRIVRALANVNAVSIHTSHSACHAVVLDEFGTAYLFGRNTSSCLGVANTPVIYENEPRKLRPVHLGTSPEVKFVSAAVGRSHTLLIDSDGNVWSAGSNILGQCGQPRIPSGSPAEIQTFRCIQGAWTKGASFDKVVRASAGLTFSLVVTESGKVYSFGSGEYGQLGNGRTGEHIATGNRTAFDIEFDPIRVRALDDKQIVQVACGQSHSVALDSEGFVYVWGAGGYCRTGLGSPKDNLLPVLVPKFAQAAPTMRGEQVYAGHTSTVVVDRQGMYWLAGKWKNSGDGSGGQPFSNFRYLQEIMTCRILGAACGGVTMFSYCPADEGVMTIGWGQNANNFELGLGEGAPKSATKPVEIEALKGIDIIGLAAGQHSSFFLARPNDALSNLDRFPEVQGPEECLVCIKADNEDALLECEKCEKPYHTTCLTPPLPAVPEGEWFCPDCASTIDSTNCPPPPPAPTTPPPGSQGPGRPPHGQKGKKAPKRAYNPEPEEDEENGLDDENSEDDERSKKRAKKDRW